MQTFDVILWVSWHRHFVMTFPSGLHTGGKTIPFPSPPRSTPASHGGLCNVPLETRYYSLHNTYRFPPNKAPFNQTLRGNKSYKHNSRKTHTGNRERESEKLLKQGFSFFLSSTFFFFFFLRTYDATLHRIEKRLNGFHMLENNRTRVLSILRKTTFASLGTWSSLQRIRELQQQRTCVFSLFFFSQLQTSLSRSRKKNWSACLQACFLMSFLYFLTMMITVVVVTRRPLLQ